MARYIKDAEACAEAILAEVGPELRLITTLAIGKPNHILNGHYLRAKKFPEIKLTIYTALSLERPKGRLDLDKRLIDPLAERIFGNYPDLFYDVDRVQEKLPPNVEVIEFYFPAGKFLHNAYAQQRYISSNYTHVVRDVFARGINVFVQQVSKAELDGTLHYSLSSNADLSLDALDRFREQRAKGEKVLGIAQVNGKLPFMFGDAILRPDDFDLIVDEPSEYYQLFSPPKAAVQDAEHMIGLY